MSSSQGQASRAERSVWAKQAYLAVWSLAWALLMSKIEAGRGIQSHTQGLMWLLFYVVGVGFCSRPLRTVGETLVLSAGAALVFQSARTLLQVYFGLAQLTSIRLGLRLVVSFFEGWLVLSMLLLVGRGIVRRLSIVPYLGKCVHCDYDLKGNASGTCPECGEAIHEDQRRYLRRQERESLQSESGH
ncbi:MAG TPA: hypothetical protein P5081_10725 [Phycisphaerae bacterium]|nr:hypothetical protein [Phycisphaerae bacterium]HRW53352.1 hypothetical protein [Phycisphaerae bacterium]